MKNNLRVVVPVLMVLCVGGVSVFLTRTATAPVVHGSAAEKAPVIEQASAPVSMKYKDLIEVYSPVANTVISLASTKNLEIKGQARGTWYFEGTFPVELVNALGDTVAKGIAHADGEWMTTAFVPFTVELSIPPTVTTDQTGKIGMIVLKKDNPSGDPAKDDAFEVPVQFAP